MEKGQIRRLLLVEDHTSFRQMLALVLDREPDFEVAVQAGSLAGARRLLKSSGDDIDLAILDFSLPDGEGVDLIGELHAANPHFAALVLTASVDRSERARAVEAGAAGVLHKSADVGEIIGAARRLLAGETLLSPEEISELLRLAARNRERERRTRSGVESLTPREREILEALAGGLSGREIAQHLHVSVETERSHMVNILRKLGANSRLQALVLAARYGLIEFR